MRIMEEDEYLNVEDKNLFGYSLGDTVSFNSNNMIGCGYIKQRRSAFYNGNVGVYYVINDVYFGDVLVEEGCIIKNEISLLIECLTKSSIGPADYK